MIAAQIEKIKALLPKEVTLVAVSKFHPAKQIEEAYRAGQRVFGESRPLEMFEKVDILPKDIDWHFIGHLQTNKIKYVLPYVKMIHSVDSEKLLYSIDKFSSLNSLTTKLLLEVHIAQESSKQGFSKEELLSLLEKLKSSPLRSSKICGLMGMATFTNDDKQIRGEFRFLKDLFEQVKSLHPELSPDFKELSMGMSGDYHIAIEEGSTIVRIGTQIFGER